MEYWDNSDGTFTVKAWLVTYANQPPKLVYTHSDAFNEWCSPGGLRMDLRLVVRDHRPAIGTEIRKPSV